MKGVQTLANHREQFVGNCNFMKRNIIFQFIVYTSHFVMFACLVDAQPSSQQSRRSIATEVYSILRIPVVGPSYLPQLAAVMAVPVNERVAGAKLVEDLVDILLAGGAPDEFGNMLASRTKLNLPVGPGKEDKTHGIPPDRIKLVNLLWSQALATNGTGPRKEAYAKAAFLLAANEDFLNGVSMIRRLYRDASRFEKVAQLTPEQAKRLGELMISISAHDQDNGLAFRDLVYAEAAIIKASRSIPQENLEQELKALKQQWNVIDKMPGWSLGNRFQVILSAWNLRNLAHARNDLNAQTAVDGLLSSWKSDDNPEPMKKWLEEAMTTFGPPPTRSRIIGPAAPKD